MKFTDEDFLPDLDEVRMDPTSFAQAVEQGHAAGVLVGFEFEVCVPEATLKSTVPGGESNTLNKTVDDVDDELYSEDVFDVEVGNTYGTVTMTLEWFDNTFKFKQPLKGFNSTVDAYPEYTNNIIPRIIELYNTVPPKKRKDYTGQALKMIQQDNPRFSFNSTKLEDQIRFASMFGRILYLKNSGELEQLGYKIRNLANRSETWHSFLSWLTDNARVDSQVSRYFDFDPNKVWTELSLSDYDDDDWDDEDTAYEAATKVLQPAVATAMSRNVNVFHSYHQKTKNITDWYIEPDGSLEPDNEDDSSAEIVSPPLPALDAIDALNKFYGLSQQLGLYTNSSTGLHINVSIPQKLDVLKLAVFLGDQYVLKYFGREDNGYAVSVLHHLKGAAPIHGEKVKIKNKQKDIFGRLSQTTEIKYNKLKNIVNDISGRHTASISNNGKYISFRHAGGDYLADLQGIKNTVGRFVRAMIIASDPTAYVQEYKTKLAKLTQETHDVNPAMTSQLVNYLRTKGAPALTVNLSAFDSKPKTALSYCLSLYGLNDKDVKVVMIANGAPVKQQFLTKVQNLARLRIDRTADDKFATYQFIPINIKGLKVVNSIAANGSIDIIENKEGDDIAYVMPAKSIVPSNDPVVQHLIKQVLIAIYKK